MPLDGIHLNPTTAHLLRTRAYLEQHGGSVSLAVPKCYPYDRGVA